MRDKNIQDSILKTYYEMTKTAQNKNHALGRLIKMPNLKEFINCIGINNITKETIIVLKAYQNMAIIWDSAGGVVPDPITYKLLLLAMGCNYLAFKRKKRTM